MIKNKMELFKNHGLLAIFADISYDDIVEYNRDGWKNLEHYENKESGFFGQAFINNENKEIVIAFRGSDNLPDWFYSNICWQIGCIPLQYYDAEDFAISILKDYQGLGFHLYLTGHSLGGALAQLIAISMGMYAVTFDSPGTLLPAKKLFSTNKITEYRENIIAYISAVNMVNTAGEHVVKELIELVDDSFFDSCAESYIEATISRHNINKIGKCFDEVTGKPYSTKLITARGMFDGHKEFRKTCGVVKWKEVENLYNCVTVPISDGVKRLLYNEIVFDDDTVKIEKGFLFLKKEAHCKHDLSDSISNKLYQERLKSVQSLEIDNIVNVDSPPFSEHSIDADIRKESDNDDELLDVYTISKIWYMNTDDMQSFYTENYERLCNKYNCVVNFSQELHEEL